MTHKEIDIRNTEIIRLLKMGKSHQEVADQFELGKAQIMQIEKRRQTPGRVVLEQKEGRNGEIFKLFRQGLSHEEIAGKFRISTSSVYGILKQNPEIKLGVAAKKEERNRRILKLLKQKMPREEISRQLNVSRELIRQLGIMHGVITPSKTTDKGEVIALLKQGYSMQEVADKFGVTIHNIWHITRNAGIEEVSPRSIGRKKREERNNLIVKAIKSGSSVEKVSRQFKLNKDYISILARQKGIRKRAHRSTDQRHHKTIKLFARRGKSSREISVLTGIRHGTIKIIMGKLGLSRDNNESKFIQDRNRHIGKLLKQGKSGKEILKLINTNEKDIKLLRMKLKITPGDKSEAKKRA